MNAVELAIAVYDAEFDILLHILPIAWREKLHLREPAIVVLWLAIHYRLFLRPPNDQLKLHKSGLYKILSHANALSDYRMLDARSVRSWVGLTYPNPLPRAPQPSSMTSSEYRKNKLMDTLYTNLPCYYLMLIEILLCTQILCCYLLPCHIH